MDTHHEPQTLTVEEAARVLRIGRTTAYALAREWRATKGRSGLPVLELGRSLRVPRAALAHLLGAPVANEISRPARRASGLNPFDRQQAVAAKPSRKLDSMGVQGRLWS